ncbi:PREDICTED: opticin [Propithecus coquereli]|uniref:Opticin n=1 Tax=Propithecus coquereli TaxID=379532 RepID=A0A2K6GU71_PROCO|nr:PREDICTED: opticin [Propithecus coquereli]
MRLLAFLGLLALVLREAGTASLPKEGRKRREEQTPREEDSYAALPVGNNVPNPDNYGDVIDLSNYEELTDYGEQLLEIKVTSLAPPTRVSATKSSMPARTSSANPMMTRPTTLGLSGFLANHDLPTCLVCVCLGSSVYCDDIDLEDIPPLPWTTVYLYARFNRISHVRAGDFEGLTKLKRIDLSSNSISSIDNDAFRMLSALQHLILPGNKLAALPVLPGGIEFLDVRLNRLRSSGIHPGAFRAMKKLQFLFLADNLLESVPGPFPLSLRSLHLQNNRIETMQRDTFCDPEEHKHTRRQLEDIRLDGNPINLSLFPSAYFCLPRLPVGRFT